ncbi:hypothetical protein SAY86_030556 [Trapa natans]|uniref:Uncharacterized protein n=1 Tax=Trapa natans TaxID=22666 RepID=A0AAN7RDS7_TRANT|nr:hypothetical protein SAY86_030556 [Trapa natans]
MERCSVQGSSTSLSTHWGHGSFSIPGSCSFVCSTYSQLALWMAPQPFAYAMSYRTLNFLQAHGSNLRRVASHPQSSAGS